MYVGVGMSSKGVMVMVMVCVCVCVCVCACVRVCVVTDSQRSPHAHSPSPSYQGLIPEPEKCAGCYTIHTFEHLTTRGYTLLLTLTPHHHPHTSNSFLFLRSILAARAEGYPPLSFLTGETLDVLPAENAENKLILLGGDIFA